jgi:hypothetical protein
MAQLSIQDFVTYIYNDEIGHENKIVYIAVGSAAHMAREINGQKVIEVNYDQQYPLFLRNIKRDNPHHKIYIVLIDPMLESPSFTVVRKIKDGAETPYEDNWSQHVEYQNVYDNFADNITLMEFKNYIYYDDSDNRFRNEKANSIEREMSFLINIAMIDKWFVILMEYTGRNLYELARQYDTLIGKDKDHIFVGLPTRIDGGCYVEIENKYNHFVTDTSKGYLTAFAPFNFEKNELSSIYHKLLGNESEQNEIKCKQIEIAFARNILCFKNTVLTEYRRILAHRKNISENKSGLEFRENEYLSRMYNIKNLQESVDTNLNGAIERLSTITDIEFENIVTFFNKREYTSEYYHYKSNPDPYSMYGQICGIINQFIPQNFNFD